MGSVGDDHKCPHCDGIGFGGYAPDGIDYPICTQGKANCLDKAVDGMTSRMEVQNKKYAKIFEKANHNIMGASQREVLVANHHRIFDHIMEFM